MFRFTSVSALLFILLSITGPASAADVIDPKVNAAPADVPDPSIVAPVGVIALERTGSKECPKGTKPCAGKVTPPSGELWCQSDLAPPVPPPVPKQLAPAAAAPKK